MKVNIPFQALQGYPSNQEKSLQSLTDLMIISFLFFLLCSIAHVLKCFISCGASFLKDGSITQKHNFIGQED